MTGELTQRIGEIVLDGSEAWAYGAGNSNETIALFYLKLDDNMKRKASINDKLPSIGGFSVNFGEGIYVDGDINIRINRNKLNGSTVNNFKQWLSQNPITLQYQLATESIKTVDLSSSGNWEKVVLNGSENWTHSKQQLFYGNVCNQVELQHRN